MRVKVSPTSCRCGGNYAWLVEKEENPGVWVMHGCVCHYTPPLGILGQPLKVDDMK